MTRKDYVLIAKALADTRPLPSTYHGGRNSVAFTGHTAQWSADRSSIAEALRADNPNFDINTFFRATEEQS